jgi:2-keto-4-pentenoate hydratase/2-oxohepta-3-ene-1,7-dioic acid hydratase in catechol pathway
VRDATSGGPFTESKCQDNFLVLSKEFIAKDQIEDPHNVLLQLSIDGEVKQEDLTGNMLFKIHEQINFVSENGISINRGDLLLSGTPEGISFVSPGNLLEAKMYVNDQLIASIKQFIIREVADS